MESRVSHWEVHLDRPRGIALGLLVAAVVTAMTLLISPVCAIGSIVPALILMRYADPRPQLVLDENGATFGGLFKSTAWRDVHVPWSEVEGVGSVATPDRDIKITRSTSFAPQWMTHWQARVLLPVDTLAVTTTRGRTFRVSEPGRGVRLEEVRTELLRRIEHAGITASEDAAVSLIGSAFASGVLATLPRFVP